MLAKENFESSKRPMLAKIREEDFFLKITGLGVISPRQKGQGGAIL